ncbi:hypothetical protein [Nocardia stercoris]|uniref:Uncharacterized protein n=1 Tax=Nocardia stercoris TaxID=2483361 RepID=A0A3M2L4P1_9NOCA|nr:hypothetical protein [Nocardia stercoris]RMI32541.1 hypothetical protein EBN03_11150 [Nocardia stercoris]
MTRRVSAGTGRLLIAAALPLAAAVTLAGAGAAAADPVAQPDPAVQPATAPLALQNIADNPTAQNSDAIQNPDVPAAAPSTLGSAGGAMPSDPVRNGAVVGAGIGSAVDELVALTAGPVVPVLLLQAAGSAATVLAGGAAATLAVTAATLIGGGSFALSGAAVGAAVGAADPNVVPQHVVVM